MLRPKIVENVTSFWEKSNKIAVQKWEIVEHPTSPEYIVIEDPSELKEDYATTGLILTPPLALTPLWNFLEILENNLTPFSTLEISRAKRARKKSGF